MTSLRFTEWSMEEGVLYNLVFTEWRLCVSQNNWCVRRKWYEWGFYWPLLCTYRLNLRNSRGCWNQIGDTALQTQDSKYEPWRTRAELATSRSLRLPACIALHTTGISPVWSTFEHCDGSFDFKTNPGNKGYRAYMYVRLMLAHCLRHLSSITPTIPEDPRR